MSRIEKTLSSDRRRKREIERGKKEKMKEREESERVKHKREEVDLFESEII